MKKPALGLIVLLVGIGSSVASSQHPPAKDRVHMDWLLDRIDEAKSVEEGMSLEDLLKVFRLEAGLQFMDLSGPSFFSRSFTGFFSLRSCEYIKLDTSVSLSGGLKVVMNS